MHDLSFYKEGVSRFDSRTVIESDSCEVYAAKEKMKDSESNFRQIFSSCLVSLGWLLLEWDGEQYKVLDYPVEKM